MRLKKKELKQLDIGLMFLIKIHSHREAKK
jgi:hypothetical protein